VANYSKEGSEILHGRGLEHVRHKIAEAFARAHEKDAADLSNNLKLEIRPTKPLAERAENIVKSAMRSPNVALLPAQPQRTNVGGVYHVEIPTESEAELIDLALRKLGVK
jgi:hypothetical protein